MSQIPSNPEKEDGPVNPEVFQTWFKAYRRDPNDNATYEEFMERIRLAKEAFAQEKEDRLKREAEAKANLETES